MLKKGNRLTKHGSFSYVYRKGKSLQRGLIRLIFVPARSAVRVGFSVSNKVGKAVKRNKVRRRMRAVAAEFLPKMKSCQVVFVASPGSAELSYCEIRSVMENLLRRSAIIDEKKGENT